MEHTDISDLCSSESWSHTLSFCKFWVTTNVIITAIYLYGYSKNLNLNKEEKLSNQANFTNKTMRIITEGCVINGKWCYATAVLSHY